MRIAVLLSCLALAACARPVADIPSAPHNSLRAEIRHETGDILDKYVEAQRRLLTVGAPLLLKNADLCPLRARSPGFTVYSDFDLPKPLQDVAYERLLLGRDAVVLSVFPQTQAWDSGLRPGDVLLSINNKRVRNAADARARLRRLKEAQEISFGFIREGRAFTLSLTAQPICNYKLLYQNDNRDINALADGKSILLTQGMMDFTNDGELGVIIGHELAHNIMHHLEKDRQNVGIILAAGTIIDGIAGNLGIATDTAPFIRNLYTQIWSQRFESEADYVGLYLLARAGGNIDAAAPLWRRMAAEHGMTQVKQPDSLIRTHPDAPQRFVVLEQTVREIDAKLSRHEALMPNLSHSWTYGKKYWWWQDENHDDDEPDDDDLNH